MKLSKIKKDLAVSLIMSRFECLLEAQEEYQLKIDRFQCDESTEEKRRKIARKIKRQYDIPQEVAFLVNAELIEGQLSEQHEESIRVFAELFVSGKMDDDAVGEMEFFFEEVCECDWGWIFVEIPTGYHYAHSAENFDFEEGHSESVFQTIASLASRSIRKIGKHLKAALPQAENQLHESPF